MNRKVQFNAFRKRKNKELNWGNESDTRLCIIIYFWNFARKNCRFDKIQCAHCTQRRYVRILVELNNQAVDEKSIDLHPIQE